MYVGAMQNLNSAAVFRDLITIDQRHIPTLVTINKTGVIVARTEYLVGEIRALFNFVFA